MGRRVASSGTDGADAAIARLAACCTGRGEVIERRMMGGRFLMVDGHLCCGMVGDRVMVRVGRDGVAEACAMPGVEPMRMGGRAPAGYVLLDAAALAIRPLADWVGIALGVVGRQPPRAGRPPRRA